LKKLKSVLSVSLSVLLIASMLTACGKSETMSENDIAIMESIAESVAASVAESVAESIEARNADSENQSGTDSQTSSTASAESSADTSNTSVNPIGDGFAAEHGALRVDGTQLVDQSGNPIQLYGMSTHGLAWFPQYVTKDTFQTLRDDWNTNCIRLAMYTEEYNGYCSGGNQDDLKALVRSGVDYATELGMYVIIDWHILQDQDPNVHKDQALTFFKEMSETYADHTNVLYEICNEPNGYATWDSIKSYAEEVIPVIRANDPDAIVIVGTPTWSQDIDQALANPLKEDNVLYALHFYAGTHKDVLWNRLDSCVQNGLPVFISEFGMCDSSGNGANDFESTQNWFNVIEKYNISFCCWNLANKDEASSVIKSSCSKVSGWTEDDLSESGKWIRDYFRSK
jgi:endoglucanase